MLSARTSLMSKNLEASMTVSEVSDAVLKTMSVFCRLLATSTLDSPVVTTCRQLSAHNITWSQYKTILTTSLYDVMETVPAMSVVGLCADTLSNFMPDELAASLPIAADILNWIHGAVDMWRQQRPSDSLSLLTQSYRQLQQHIQRASYLQDILYHVTRLYSLLEAQRPMYENEIRTFSKDLDIAPYSALVTGAAATYGAQTSSETRAHMMMSWRSGLSLQDSASAPRTTLLQWVTRDNGHELLDYALSVVVPLVHDPQYRLVAWLDDLVVACNKAAEHMSQSALSAAGISELMNINHVVCSVNDNAVSTIVIDAVVHGKALVVKDVGHNIRAAWLDSLTNYVKARAMHTVPDDVHIFGSRIVVSKSFRIMMITTVPLSGIDHMNTVPIDMAMDSSALQHDINNVCNNCTCRHIQHLQPAEFELYRNSVWANFINETNSIVLRQESVRIACELSSISSTTTENYEALTTQLPVLEDLIARYSCLDSKPLYSSTVCDRAIKLANIMKCMTMSPLELGVMYRICQNCDPDSWFSIILTTSAWMHSPQQVAELLLLTIMTEICNNETVDIDAVINLLKIEIHEDNAVSDEDDWMSPTTWSRLKRMAIVPPCGVLYRSLHEQRAEWRLCMTSADPRNFELFKSCNRLSRLLLVAVARPEMLMDVLYDEVLNLYAVDMRGRGSDLVALLRLLPDDFRCIVDGDVTVLQNSLDTAFGQSGWLITDQFDVIVAKGQRLFVINDTVHTAVRLYIPRVTTVTEAAKCVAMPTSSSRELVLRSHVSRSTGGDLISDQSDGSRTFHRYAWSKLVSNMLSHITQDAVVQESASLTCHDLYFIVFGTSEYHQRTQTAMEDITEEYPQPLEINTSAVSEFIATRTPAAIDHSGITITVEDAECTGTALVLCMQSEAMSISRVMNKLHNELDDLDSALRRERPNTRDILMLSHALCHGMLPGQRVRLSRWWRLALQKVEQARSWLQYGSSECWDLSLFECPRALFLCLLYDKSIASCCPPGACCVTISRQHTESSMSGSTGSLHPRGIVVTGVRLLGMAWDNKNEVFVKSTRSGYESVSVDVVVAHKDEVTGNDMRMCALYDNLQDKNVITWIYFPCYVDIPDACMVLEL